MNKICGIAAAFVLAVTCCVSCSNAAPSEESSSRMSRISSAPIDTAILGTWSGDVTGYRFQEDRKVSLIMDFSDSVHFDKDGNPVSEGMEYADGDLSFDGKTIKQNDFMGIGDKSILSVGTDLMATTLEMVDAMVDEDSAIVSIYFGSDSDEDSANELAAAIEEKYPDVEVEVNDGGQPIYYYVISVE